MKKAKIILAILTLVLLIMGISVFAANTSAETDRKPPFGFNLSKEQEKILTEKIIEDLNEMVESGDLTQEQYDIISDRIEKSFPIDMGRAMHKPRITEDQKEKLVEKFKAEQEKKLAAGEITQEEYDKLIENADENMFKFARRPGMPQMEKGESEEEEKPVKRMRKNWMHKRTNLGGRQKTVEE